MQPSSQEQYRDASTRLTQLGAQRMPDRDAHGMQVYSSPYGWIGVQAGAGGMTVLKFYPRCPCNS